MSSHTTKAGGEGDVPIPPPRQLFAAAAIGGLVGAAAGAMLVIWLIGCDCCDDPAANARTGQVETTIAAPGSELDTRLG